MRPLPNRLEILRCLEAFKRFFVIEQRHATVILTSDVIVIDFFQLGVPA